MSGKMKLALVAVLVAASASSALAANNKMPVHRMSARAAVTEGLRAPVMSPEDERRWMERASAPSSL